MTNRKRAAAIIAAFALIIASLFVGTTSAFAIAGCQSTGSPDSFGGSSPGPIHDSTAPFNGLYYAGGYRTQVDQNCDHGSVFIGSDFVTNPANNNGFDHIYMRLHVMRPDGTTSVGAWQFCVKQASPLILTNLSGTGYDIPNGWKWRADFSVPEMPLVTNGLTVNFQW